MSQTNSEDQNHLPDNVGPYRIEGRLGIGGMGQVYRAWDLRLERSVAIKHILPADDADARARERLRREARAVASLNHPAIVQIHDILETSNGDWIVMELVEGRTLHELLAAGLLDLGPAIHLAREVTEGLAEAHGKGIVHRDLKTENIMVIPTGHAKILDFGLAKQLRPDSDDATLSVQGTILGTGRSMSPEQVLGEEVDHRSDLFSLGTLLYESVTGHRPFAGTSLILTLAQVCTARQSPAAERNPNVPEELSALIDRLLEKDPSDRPQSAEEVAEMLEGISGTLSSEQAASKVPRLVIGPRPPGDQTPTDADQDTLVAPVLDYGSAEPLPGPEPDEMQASPGAEGEPAEATTGVFVKTLMRVALAADAGWADRVGESRAYELSARNDRLVRDLLRQFEGLEIHKTDGFLLLFERPIDAVQFAVAHYHQLAKLSEEVGVDLRARAGIHLGEVFLRKNVREDVVRGAKPLEVEGAGKLMVRRTAALAQGGQILLTQEAYDLARRAAIENPRPDQDLLWVSHGPYQLRDVAEPVPIFEVTARPATLLGPPPDTDEARRVAAVLPRARRRGRLLATAFALLALLVAIATLLRFRTSLPLSGEAREVRPSVAVLGFKNLSESEESAWLSTALAEVISTELAAGEDLRLIPGERVARLKTETELADTDTLAEDTLAMIGENLETDFVILGSYISLEQGGKMPRVRVQLRLQETRTGDEIWAGMEQGDQKDLFDLVSRIGGEVRRKLGVEEITSDEAAAVRATLSASPEAVRLYFEGLDRLRSFEALRARNLFQKAIDIDSDWALAHAALGQAWLALGYDREAEQSAGKAFELAENLPREEQLWIQGRYYEAAGQWQAAIRTIHSLWGFFQDNVEYGLRLAELQTRAGQAKEALATVATLRDLLGSAATDPRIDLAEAAANHSLNEFKLAIAAAQAAVKKATASEAWILAAEGWRLQGQAHYELHKTEDSQPNLRAAGRYLEQAKSRFEQAGDRGKVAEVLYLTAFKVIDEDDLAGAEELFRQALAIHRETGSRQRLSDALNGLSFIMGLRGELLAARPIVDQAVEAARATGRRDRFAEALDTKAFLLYRVGDLPGAEEASSQALAEADEIGDRIKSGWSHYSLGRTALAAGKVVKAHSHFEGALEIGDEIGNGMLRTYALRGLGEVLLAQGELAEALKKIEQSQAADKTTTAETQMAYARLLLELGQPAKAEALARQAAESFKKPGESDNEAAATAVAAQSLVAQQQLPAARRMVAPAREHAYRGENLVTRHQVEIVDSRLLAASHECRQALQLAEKVLSEATNLAMVSTMLEARLALGEIEIACHVAGPDKGRARLQKLAREAEEQGFRLIARKAQEARLSTSPASSPPRGPGVSKSSQ